MTLDAIQEDVSGEEQDEASMEMTPSELAREAIVESRNKERLAAEGLAPVDETLDPPPVVHPADVEETVKFYDDDGKEYSVPASAKMRLKIDGTEVDEPLKTVHRNYQKGVSGDKRLEQAAAKQRDLEALERTLNARGDALTQQEQATLTKLKTIEQKQQAGNLSEDDALVAAEELFESLYDSDEDKRKERIAKVLRRVARPQEKIDMAELRNSVRSEVEQSVLTKVRAETAAEKAATEAANYAATRTAANDKFYEDYPEIANDVDLFAMTNVKAFKLREGTPNADPWEIIKTAADETRAFVEKLKGPPAKSPQIPSPRTAAGRSGIGKDAPPPKTREDVLSEMQQSRVGTGGSSPG